MIDVANPERPRRRAVPIRLLCVLAVLLVWKTIRTDWVVVAPYWFHDIDPPPSDVYTTTEYQPPVCPLWRPPQPHEVNPTAPNWEPFFPSGGNYGITGEPQLRVNWTLIGIKLVCAFAILYPTVVFLSYVARRIEKRASLRQAGHPGQ